MTILQAVWDGNSLHLWAEVARPANGGPAGTTEAPDFLDAVELRSICGECWDPLLISSAEDARLELHLPFCDDAYLVSTVPRSHAADRPIRLQARTVPTLRFAPADAVDLLDAHARTAPGDLHFGTTLQFWSKSAALLLELLAKQQFVPATQLDHARKHRGRWLVVTGDPATADRVRKLAHAMPQACLATAADSGRSPVELMESFLLETGDALVRRSLVGDELAQTVIERGSPGRPSGNAGPAEGARTDEPSLLIRWLRSLVAENPTLAGTPEECEAFSQRVLAWIGRVVDTRREDAVRTCMRLVPPPPDNLEDGWRLELYAQDIRHPENVLAGEELAAKTPDRYPGVVPDVFDQAIEKVRRDAAHAAEHFPPLAVCAGPDGPLECRLTTADAYAFLRDAALVLESEGFGVSLPEWWTRNVPRVQVRMRLRPHEESPTDGAMSLDALVAYDWRAAVGDEDLTLDELSELASQQQPLVRVHGRWAEVQPKELARALEFLQNQSSETTTLLSALRYCYAVDESETGLPVAGFSADGWIGVLLGSTDTAVQLEPVPVPSDFIGALRPYQLRGLQWLSFLSRVGVGACLADDMGLGKTIQLIALLLHEREAGHSPGPTLLVVPMSLVGNWQREIERFGPTLRVMVHHGLERRAGQAFIDEAARHDVVISTYGLIHRDFEYLSAVAWGRLALDEAQNVKNPAAKQSVAVRALRAGHRVALTGTPVENHLTELWTIMDFLNHGYLGSAGDFRRRFAIPIERHQDRVRAERLRQLIRPFVLRRKKNDPKVQVDLPPKLEMRVYCNLTREQAGLYQSVVNDMLGQIDGSEGMQRRGLILAAMVRLKQLCNHPALLSGDDAHLPQRSGKCERLTDMLDEVLAEGDRALVFTQFREMGHLLQRLLVDRFQRTVLFLHGGTTQKERDAMVQRFQAGVDDTPLFILSLKAGGFGLNLTAANHVFHFDRWWNPAVEDQAADRVHRIGQHRQVQVHKFVCVGTLEERIDAMLEKKRSLAESVIGTGESWVTELSTEALRELFALSRDAVGEE